MTIEQLDCDKVLISLCNEDMQDYKLRFSDMSFCSEHSKRVLLRLLKLACAKAGVNYESKTLLMEALPHNSGCLLLVTMMEKKKRKTYKVKRIKEYPCFVFSAAEDVLSAAENSKRRGVSLSSNSLWLCGDMYYLVFDYPLVSKSLCSVLCEYSRVQRFTQAGVARIKERGKLLCENNALNIIGKILIK